jgi:glyoxylase-like metal-dependent hydrolase (beta-lactamase superfamily II)
MATKSSAISAAELAARLGTRDAPLVLDVRGTEEHAEWHIPGSVNVPLDRLADRLPTLPHDRQIVVVCAAGGRSAQAHAYLDAAGFDVTDLTGGMRAWAEVYDTAELDLPGGATVVQVRRRAKGCLSYVVGAGDEAFVVDPSLDVDQYRRVAAAHGWRITHVFDTHLHADHLSGGRALATATGATLHLNPADHFDFDYEPLRDGERFELPGGLHVDVSALHTPGHTRGSTVYRIGDRAVLTGDLLFTDGIGRPDLAECANEFANDLHRSLTERILPLPDDTVILPAHHGEDASVLPGVPVAATLGALRASLPPLRMARPEFVAWAEQQVAARPPNYREIVLANINGSTTSDDRLRSLELGPNRCAVTA